MAGKEGKQRNSRKGLFW